MIELWTEATRDIEAENLQERLVRARVATRGIWPFLASSRTEEEFTTRTHLVEARVTQALNKDPTILPKLKAAWQEDYKVIQRNQKLTAQSHEDAYKHGWDHAQAGNKVEHAVGSWVKSHGKHNDISHHDKVRQGYRDATWLKQRKHTSMHKGAPFAGYSDFDACLEANKDKDNPSAYCGYIKNKVEDKGKKEASITLSAKDQNAANEELAALSIYSTSQQVVTSSPTPVSKVASFICHACAVGFDCDPSTSLSCPTCGSDRAVYRVAANTDTLRNLDNGSKEAHTSGVPNLGGQMSHSKTAVTGETVCVLRNGIGLDLDRYVDRTFKTEDAAHRWANQQDRNYNIVVLPGKWKAGERVPVGKGRVLGSKTAAPVRCVSCGGPVEPEDIAPEWGLHQMCHTCLNAPRVVDPRTHDQGMADWVAEQRARGDVLDIPPGWVGAKTADRQQALDRRYEMYAARFVAERGWDAPRTNEALAEVLSHEGIVRPAKPEEYDLIREAFDRVKANNAALSSKIARGYEWPSGPLSEPSRIPLGNSKAWTDEDYTPGPDHYFQQGYANGKKGIPPPAPGFAPTQKLRSAYMEGYRKGRTEAVFPKKTAGDKPPWLKDKDSGNGNTSDSSSNAPQDNDDDTDDTNGDDTQDGTLDPTAMTPGQQVAITYVMPDQTSGTTQGTFKSAQGATYLFDYDNGTFGITQGANGWVDSSGAVFTFAPVNGGNGTDNDTNGNGNGGGAKPPFPPKNSKKVIAGEAGDKNYVPGWSEGLKHPIVKEVRKRQGWELHEHDHAQINHAGIKGVVQHNSMYDIFEAKVHHPNGGGTTYLGKGGYASAKSAMDAIERHIDKNYPGSRDRMGPSTEMYYAGDDVRDRWQHRPIGKTSKTVDPTSESPNDPEPLQDPQRPTTTRPRQMPAPSTQPPVTAGIIDYYDVVVHHAGDEAPLTEHGTADLNEAVKKAQEWHAKPSSAKVWVINRGTGSVFWSNGQPNPEARFYSSRTA